MHKTVFFDRDGVINKVLFNNGKPFSPRTFTDFELIPGIGIVLNSLKKFGFLNIVITNQPDIARGLLKQQDLDKMHAIIREQLAIDDIIVCPHDDADDCYCRKPKPGMILSAAKVWDIDLSNSFVIGDSKKDIEAGKGAGCKTILIDAVYNKDVKADFRVSDIYSAAEVIFYGGR